MGLQFLKIGYIIISVHKKVKSLKVCKERVYPVGIPNLKLNLKSSPHNLFFNHFFLLASLIIRNHWWQPGMRMAYHLVMLTKNV